MSVASRYSHLKKVNFDPSLWGILSSPTNDVCMHDAFKDCSRAPVCQNLYVFPQHLKWCRCTGMYKRRRRGKKEKSTKVFMSCPGNGCYCINLHLWCRKKWPVQLAMSLGSAGEFQCCNTPTHPSPPALSGQCRGWKCGGKVLYVAHVVPFHTMSEPQEVLMNMVWSLEKCSPWTPPKRAFNGRERAEGRRLPTPVSSKVPILHTLLYCKQAIDCPDWLLSPLGSINKDCKAL